MIEYWIFRQCPTVATLRNRKCRAEKQCCKSFTETSGNVGTS
jgi:hypothetical protein